MRLFLLSLLVTVAVGVFWLLDDANKKSLGEAVPKERITIILSIDRAPEQEKRATDFRTYAEASQQEEGECFTWGPFSEKQLVGIRLNLQRQGLIERMELRDRHLPERWIVYLGPFSNATAVKAFSKQFTQQGFKNVHPIYEGALSYGVEIESFATREDAEKYIANKKAPDVSGIRVTNRLGGLSGDVDLIFQNITQEQILWLQSQAIKYPGKVFQSCSMYEKTSEDNLGR